MEMMVPFLLSTIKEFLVVAVTYEMLEFCIRRAHTSLSFVLFRLFLSLHKVVYFLTMLVGAGGNAGNQASVRVIRGLALGTLNDNTQGQFLARELKMAVSLSAILSLAGFIRAAVFRTPIAETLAVTAALAMIVFSSVCLGALLPLLLKKLRVDPAHSSTTIQVIMDILGVVLAVAVSSILLDSPLGSLLINKLSGV
jgi:Mg/Co/Ni transporter MgtE